MNILRYEQLNENKMWYKTIPGILEWIELKSNKNWIFADVETTGLGGPKKQQITQVSAIATQYDFNTNTFKELGEYDQKVKLNTDTKARYETPGDDSRKILSFNHYGDGQYTYRDEREIVDEFFNWVDQYTPFLLVAQNAGFDMSMLSGRFGHKLNNEVFDTKMLIQLYYLPLIQKLAETDTKYQELINFIGTSARDNGLISSSLSKIGPALGLNMSGYHDALTDVKITIEMFKRIVDFLKENQSVDIMKYQSDRIKVIRG
jgi:DNA polymerase III alpha subunit (gram-positive type)